ncbi:MAG: cell division protein FtsQ [Thermoleophilaceae bacterium]|jgi:cell division protein FtsQ|nr:cell division protein FtsQ [Thermoleophilaceae bacterium]
MREAATIALRSVPRAALAVPPVWRRRLAAVLAALIVLGSLYWFWFRDSSFARVKDVQISGVSGPQARSIRNALETAGLNQTTLDVSDAELRAAVADFPVVRSITAQGNFPHELVIDVDLNMPVAILQTPSGRRPVAADGLFLPDVPVSGGLPLLKTNATVSTERVTAGAAFDLVRVAGLAPEPLRVRLKDVSFKAGLGIVATMVQGPDLIFGDANRLPAKWMAAARVLAASGARGASYIDLRLPDRPAAGGLATTTVLPLAPAGAVVPAPVAPATTTGTTTAPSTATTGQTPTATTTAPAPAATGQTQAAPPTTPTTAASPATTGGATQAPQNPQPQVQTTP